MESKLRVSGIVEESIVDGPGIRYVVFTQGCPHHCSGCHNPQTHTFTGGKLMDIRDIFSQIGENPLLKGVTISGGEPFCQPAPLAALARLIRTTTLNIITYTGYTFEELLKSTDPYVSDLLRQTDILIDGRFEIEKRDLTMRFKGSTNQRIIDVKESLKNNDVVLFSLE